MAEMAGWVEGRVEVDDVETGFASHRMLVT